MKSRKTTIQSVATNTQHHIPILGVFCGLWIIASISLFLPITTLAAEAVSDVRVLIDVSGSMKANDPQNLRTPAVRMLAGLLPDGARSGIWTFGHYVNMQVKLDEVDEAWKKRAMSEADKIHSRGLYTNIEEAVKTATSDWQTPDPRFKRHLILLTDGMVDIDKDARVNEQSRRRLLQEILPRVEAADAAIHTIALSKNADAELLNALSGATKGSFEQVDSADQLQRLFLKLFEKSVKPDTVPIEDNKFTVDKHVSDITVLVFRTKDSPATVMTLPSGQEWSQKSHPGTVNWHHEESYDLVTAKGPEAGEWLLQAKVDPDNRVMVVTNLRLSVDKLPNTLMLGDQFDVRARLLEDGKTVTNPNLLSKTEFEVKRIDKEDHVISTELSDKGEHPDVIKGDGVYSVKISDIDKAGAYELSVRAKSLTFKRAIRHSLQIYDSPANIRITQEGPDKPFVITIQPHAGLIRPETVSMQITLPDGEPQIIKQIDDLQWSVEVPPGYANKSFKLTLAGNRYTDEQVKMEFEQVIATTGNAQSLALKITPASKQAEAEPVAVEKEAPAETEPVESATEETKDEGADGFNWALVLTLVVIVNLLVLAGGWFAYRIWRKRQTASDDEVTAELES